MIPNSKSQRITQLNMFLVNKDCQPTNQSPSTSTKITSEFFFNSTNELKQTKKWTKKENDIYFNVIAEDGNDIKRLVKELPLRTVSQLNYHTDLMFKRIKKNIIYLRAIEDIEEKCFKIHMIKQIFLTLGTKLEKEKYEIHISKEIAIEIVRIVNKIIPLSDNDLLEIFQLMPSSVQLLNDEVMKEEGEDNETISDGDSQLGGLGNEDEDEEDIQDNEEDEDEGTDDLCNKETIQVPDFFKELKAYYAKEQGSIISEERQFLNKKRELDNNYSDINAFQQELESTKQEGTNTQLDLISTFFNSEVFFGSSNPKSIPNDHTEDNKEKNISSTNCSSCIGGRRRSNSNSSKNSNNSNNTSNEDCKAANINQTKLDEVYEKTRTPLTEEDVLVVDNPFNLSFDEYFISTSNENDINIDFNVSFSNNEEI